MHKAPIFICKKYCYEQNPFSPKITSFFVGLTLCQNDACDGLLGIYLQVFFV